MIVDKNSPVPQYFQLQNWLIEQIEQGVFKPDDKIPTEEELSKVAGLARATIRQAVQNLVNTGYLLRKRRLGTFVIKREKGTKKKTIIGVILPDIRRGCAAELARGAEDEAAQNKHSIILCNTDDLFVKADLHSDRLIEHAVSGVIFVPTAASAEKNRLILEKFARHNISVVLADRIIPNFDIDYITTDNFQGAYDLTKHLINKGHERIAIILSTIFSTELQRLEGYRKALCDHNIPIDDSLIFAKEGPFNEKHYLPYVNRILAQADNFTAIFAGHDRIAYLIYSVAEEMGLSIPEDFSLVGYDDLPFTQTHPVSLTTIHQPIYEMGKESMKLIIAKIHGEITETQRIVLNAHLVERSSVCAPKVHAIADVA